MPGLGEPELADSFKCRLTLAELTKPFFHLSRRLLAQMYFRVLKCDIQISSDTSPIGLIHRVSDMPRRYGVRVESSLWLHFRNTFDSHATLKSAHGSLKPRYRHDSFTYVRARTSTIAKTSSIPDGTVFVRLSSHLIEPRIRLDVLLQFD